MVLVVVLATTQEHKEKVMKGNNATTQAPQQRTITSFFSPVAPNATSQLRSTQI